ncbi:hypothetical protein B0H19DRAFT_1070227 [Mycena capillaripes]|nr:hypothetical protein B0H19DRAFT_1070227 [Mycena capillaripes]
MCKECESFGDAYIMPERFIMIWAEEISRNDIGNNAGVIHHPSAMPRALYPGGVIHHGLSREIRHDRSAMMHHLRDAYLLGKNAVAADQCCWHGNFITAGIKSAPATLGAILLRWHWEFGIFPAGRFPALPPRAGRPRRLHTVTLPRTCANRCSWLWVQQPQLYGCTDATAARRQGQKGSRQVTWQLSMMLPAAVAARHYGWIGRHQSDAYEHTPFPFVQVSTPSRGYYEEIKYLTTGTHAIQPKLTTDACFKSIGGDVGTAKIDTGTY